MAHARVEIPCSSFFNDEKGFSLGLFPLQQIAEQKTDVFLIIYYQRNRSDDFHKERLLLIMTQDTEEKQTIQKSLRRLFLLLAGSGLSQHF